MMPAGSAVAPSLSTNIHCIGVLVVGQVVFTNILDRRRVSLKSWLVRICKCCCGGGPETNSINSNCDFGAEIE